MNRLSFRCECCDGLLLDASVLYCPWCDLARCDVGAFPTCPVTEQRPAKRPAITPHP